ncbi:MAG TPA: Smr/MutS family protein [Lacibacter sp.]|nr:Smr/MutS family protein [Lacibacter sp.]
MKFQIGDKVLLLHSNEEGEVVDIIDKKMVTVDVGGVQFPVYTDQIEYPYFRRFSEKKAPPAPQKKYVDNVKKEKSNAVKGYNVAEGVWIAFLPVFDKDVFDDDVVEYFRIYLVNNTETEFKFDYHLRFTGESEFNLRNEILPFNDFYIHDVEFEKLNDAPRFDFEFSLAKPDKKKADHFEASLKIKAKQLFLRIEEMLKKQEASFSYQLMETYPDKVHTEKVDLHKLSAAGFKVYDAGEARQHIPPARSVVDLHIEKISNEWKHLSNFEILTAQLREFEKYYELAVLHVQPTLIVIHGVGEGKLRDEIHDILRLKPEVKSFVNQYHPLYGYGATEIYFQY